MNFEIYEKSDKKRIKFSSFSIFAFVFDSMIVYLNAWVHSFAKKTTAKSGSRLFWSIKLGF